MTAILIIGESGSGKSSSIRTLHPQETCIINVLDKPLPFRGSNKNYQTLRLENGQSVGNYYATDQYHKIVKIINGINQNRPDIKNIVVDDFQYIMAFEFMNRALEKGYTKFTEIAKHAWEVIHAAMQTRPDLNCFFLTHADLDESGKTKAKTIGKMLDNQICLEGLFTVVLHSLVTDGQYKFLTKNDGVHIAKSPMDMFDDTYIDNDLKYVQEKIESYFNEDVFQDDAPMELQEKEEVA